MNSADVEQLVAGFDGVDLRLTDTHEPTFANHTQNDVGEVPRRGTTLRLQAVSRGDKWRCFPAAMWRADDEGAAGSFDDVGGDDDG